MFSLLVRRVVARVPTTPALLNATPRLSSATRLAWSRAFTTTPRVLEPAAAVATKKKASTTSTDKKSTGRVKKSAIKKRTAEKRAVKRSVAKKKTIKKKAIKKPSTTQPALTKDQLPPKRPLQAFVLFSLEFKERSSLSENSFIEKSKLAGEAWRALSDAEKEPYHERYKAQCATYQQAKEQYLQNTPPDILRRVRAKHKERYERRLKRDPSRARHGSAFSYYFTNWYRIEGKAIHGGKITLAMKDAASRWRNMSEEEKRPYANAILELNRQSRTAAAPAT